MTRVTAAPTLLSLSGVGTTIGVVAGMHGEEEEDGEDEEEKVVVVVEEGDMDEAFTAFTSLSHAALNAATEASSSSTTAWYAARANAASSV